MIIENNISESDNFIMALFFKNINRVSNISFYYEEHTFNLKKNTSVVGRWQKKGFQKENGKHTDRINNTLQNDNTPSSK